MIRPVLNLIYLALILVLVPFNSKISTNTNNINSINSSISSINSKVSTNTNNISSLTSKANSNSTSITSLINRVTTLESNGSHYWEYIGSSGNAMDKITLQKNIRL